MKKLLLGIVLLAALIGIVYIKSERAEEYHAQVTQEGFQAGLAEGEQLKARVDSLTGLVVEKDVAMAESVAVRDELYAGNIDSLNETIKDKDQQIADLNSQLRQKTEVAQVVAKNTSQEPDKKHLEILSFYKKAVEGLPGDLSAYERRVALSEIRNEIAQKFSITVSRLNSIRKEHNLEY